jgi:hypothetical protein
VLDDVSRELHRRSISIAGALPRRWRKQDKCRLIGVLDAEWIVRCAMHAQKAHTPVLLLGPYQCDDLRLDLCGREGLGPVLGFLVERGDRRKPVVFTRAIKVGSVLAEAAHCFGELGRLFAGDCAGHAEPWQSPYPCWSSHVAQWP